MSLKFPRRFALSGLAALCALTLIPAAPAQDLTLPAQEVGPVTGRPLPRFVSIKADKANVRRGPARSHRIDWVYQKSGLPVEIIAEYGHWRRVRDHDGLGGWIHHALLSGARYVIVDQSMISLHARPDAGSTVVARAESGVVARLSECEGAWCRITAGDYKGWVARSGIWGVYPGEEID